MKKIFTILLIIFIIACDTSDKEIFPEPGVYIKNKDVLYFNNDCIGIEYAEFCQHYTEDALPNYTEEQCLNSDIDLHWQDYKTHTHEMIILNSDSTAISIYQRCKDTLDDVYVDANNQIDCENNGGEWTETTTQMTWDFSSITSPMTISFFGIYEHGGEFEVNLEYDINTSSIYQKNSHNDTRCLNINDNVYYEHNVLINMTEEECDAINGIWKPGHCEEKIWTKE